MEKDPELPFLSHLKELRKRIIQSLLVTIIMFGICYYYSDKILHFLVQPLLKSGTNSVIAISITETFFTYIKLSLWVATGISTPIYFWHFYRFVAPGLFKTERYVMCFYLLGFICLFACGSLLMYYIVLPNAINFLSHYNKATILSIDLHARVETYVHTIAQLVIGFGLVFQLPLALILLAQAKIIKYQHLQRIRRFAIVIIFFVAAVITPPDILSQVILGTVMLVFYEVTILIIKLFIENKNHIIKKK